mgnify:CR=1 FL=1
MIEVWKDVKGYEGLYKISNLGRVKNKYDNFVKGNVIRGYVRISLSKNRNVKTTSIHRLVAEAFIPNPENKPYVNHINCDKTNNVVTNLEWCTQLENIQHCIKNGIKNDFGENSKRHKLTFKDVEFIRNNYKARDKQFGARVLAKQFNVSEREIYRVLEKSVF